MWRRRQKADVLDIKQVGWPLLRKATAYQLQHWAFLVTLDALQTVRQHVRLNEYERDWFSDLLTPVLRQQGYEAARETAAYWLAHLRPPPKRIRGLVEEMLLDDKLPGQMREAALRVAENAALLVQGACSREVAADYQLSQLAWLERVVVDVAIPVATPGDGDGRA